MSSQELVAERESSERNVEENDYLVLPPASSTDARGSVKTISDSPYAYSSQYASAATLPVTSKDPQLLPQILQPRSSSGLGAPEWNLY